MALNTITYRTHIVNSTKVQVVTPNPPTSEGCGSNPGPYVGKLVCAH